MSASEKMPRELHTPLHIADEALGIVWRWWWIPDKFGLIEDGEKHAKEFDGYLKAAIEDPNLNGEKLAEKIIWKFSGSPEERSDAIVDMAFTTIAFCVQTVKAVGDSRCAEAWSFASDAKYTAGLLSMAVTHTMDCENPASGLAKKRHAETNALKAAAVQYWRQNIDPKMSSQKAADELLKVVPLSHKKLAEYVSDAKKGKL